MRMIPASAILGSLESVGLAVTRCEGTLCDAVRPILTIAVQLTEAVPVQRCTIGLHVVVHRDRDGISPIALNRRTWYLTIHG